MSRPKGRAPDELRPIELTLGFTTTSPGSVLFRQGGTLLLVTANVSEKVPEFLAGQGTGWLTAEYSMLPGSTIGRKSRGLDGRSTEIQRLIGRSLRAAVDFKALGERTVHVDADVLQADGGTRTAAITAGWVAVAMALRAAFPNDPDRALGAQLAAVSVGIVEDEPRLDLEYSEDVVAEVDLNVVSLGVGGLVEVQGTGEHASFSRKQLDAMLDLAEKGIEALMTAQREALKSRT